jgi:hypothetical protein
MPKSKSTDWVLTTFIIVNKPKYISDLANRTWDNRKIITLTDDPEEALTWDTEHEALVMLSKCIVNDRVYTAIPKPE